MNKKAFDKLCSSLGVDAVVDKYGSSAYLTCFAPDGKIFIESTCNCLSSFDYGGRKGYMDDLRGELADMIDVGLEEASE